MVQKKRPRPKVKFGHPFIYIDRDRWGALPYRDKTPVYLETPVPIVMLYDYDRCKPCVSDFDCTREVQAIQLRQRRRRLPDLQYNFLIGGMGRTYEGRGWHIRSEVNKEHQDIVNDCLLVGLIGHSLEEEFGPNRKMRFRMMRELHEFLKYGVENHYIKPNFMLYNASPTAKTAALDIPDYILKRMKKPEYRPRLPF